MNRKEVLEKASVINTLQMPPDIFELSAIWLDRPIRTNKGKKIRINEGTLINVVDGKIQGDAVNFNSKVIGCYGTVDSKKLWFMTFNYATDKAELVEVSDES